LGVKGPSEHQSLTLNGNVRMKGLVLAELHWMRSAAANNHA